MIVKVGKDGVGKNWSIERKRGSRGDRVEGCNGGLRSELEGVE